MTSIVKATVNDFKLIAGIGKISFIESHGNSAAIADITGYVNKTYHFNVLKKELGDLNNIYHIIYKDSRPAGYSKIVFNIPCPGSHLKNITKLERLYLLKDFYGLQLGSALFRYNLELSKKNKQAGMWLFVWKENYPAVNFYKKNGFIITGSHDFKITGTHSNPNHQMLLLY